MNGIHRPGKMKCLGVLLFQGDGRILYAECGTDMNLAYVTHVRSVPRRSAFSYWKRKKAGTAGYEATYSACRTAKSYRSSLILAG